MLTAWSKMFQDVKVFDSAVRTISRIKPGSVRGALEPKYA